MKNRFISQYALVTVLLIASILPTLAAEPKVGDSVAAIWTDGNYYVGTITSISGDKADVLYEDGDKLTVPLAKVHTLSKTANFKVGDHVIAAFNGASMFPGVITAVSDATCTVKWDDGDTPLDVPKGRMIAAPK